MSLASSLAMSRIATCVLVFAILGPDCATTGGKIAAFATVYSSVLAVATFHVDLLCGEGPFANCPSETTSITFAAIAGAAALVGLVFEAQGRFASTSAPLPARAPPAAAVPVPGAPAP
jgi:hypothetical protein